MAGDSLYFEKKKSTIGIMQFVPAYFPSIQYIMALMKAKEARFTLESNYQKQTYRNRCSIYGANGKLNLTIPIQHKKDQTHQKDKEVKILWEENWQNQHWKSITTAYRSSPFFEFYEDELKEHFIKKSEGLMEYNLNLIEGVLSLLEIEIPFNFKESYSPLSTTEESWINAKIQPQIRFPVYQQVFADKHGFIPYLSILDLIFNQGPQSLDYLENLN